MEHRHRHSSIFENVRNFLVAVQEIGIPIFEASDLEQGEKSSRIVNSVLALKSYSEWKQTGANGVWKFGGTSNACCFNVYFSVTDSNHTFKFQSHFMFNQVTIPMSHYIRHYDMTYLKYSKQKKIQIHSHKPATSSTMSTTIAS